MIFIRQTSFVFLLLAVTASTSFAQSKYNVLDYGAKGDSKFENAVSIQKAIDAAAEAGGGTVVVPKGKYRTSTVFLKSNVTLRLEKGAVIKGTPKYSLYPVIKPAYETFLLRADRYPPRALVVALKQENVAIEGEGTIDGNGGAPDLVRKKRLESINLVQFIKCKNVRIEGTGPLNRKLTITSACHWAVQTIGVDGFVIRNVHIHNYGGGTPDGLAVCDSRNVVVENCRVESDDDAMSLKSGTPDILIENVTVKNSTFVSRVCGFKIGPQTFGGFKNIQISDCHFEGASIPPGTKYDPHHGVFLNIGNGGFIDGLVVENCTMQNIPSAMSIFLGQINDYYWETYWPDKPENTVPGSIKNVTFRNIVAKDMGLFGVMLEGRDESKLQNILFDNVQIQSKGGGKTKDPVPERPGSYPNLIYLFKGNVSTWGMFLRHVDGVTFKDVYLTTEEADPRPDLYVEDVDNFDRGEYEPQAEPPAKPQAKSKTKTKTKTPAGT